MLIRRLLSLLFVVGLASAAWAQDNAGCDKFKWSVARERAWFAAGAKPVAAGAELGLADQGYAVALVPEESAGFVLPPERTPKPGAFGGVLKISGLPKAGLYEITLSDEAWVDVVQNGASVKSSDFSGQKNCPGVRKSVRFPLAAGPATVQISNVASAAIQLAIAPAQ
jgi:hypothetical protein